jgi:single-stranded DNA-binding protein
MRYVMGRLVDFDNHKIVGKYAVNVVTDYVKYFVDGQEHGYQGLDWFECVAWEKWGAEIVPEAAVERVVW